MRGHRTALAAALLAACGALAACGRAGVDRPDATATLVLAGAPSAVDVGIYVASSRGYDEAEGVRLRIRAADTARSGTRRLDSGSATFAVLDIHRLAVARAHGSDAVGVMAIGQLPLDARARAALRSLGRSALARRLDLRSAPRYPQLVLATSATTLRDRPAVVRAAIAAITRGYAEELQDPEAALALELERVSPARAASIRAELPRVEASFTGTTGRVGALHRPALRAWASWAQRVGIVARRPDVAAMFPPVPAR